MEVPITLGQFILGIITILAPQIFMVIKALRDNKLQKEIEELKVKLQKPLTEAQAQSAMGDALEKLSQVYGQAQITILSQDKELSSLRPLVMDVAIAKQNATQCQLDKEDWKIHAQKLESQLIEHNIIPAVFIRQSRNQDESDKMRAITQAQIDKYLGKKENGGSSGTGN